MWRIEIIFTIKNGLASNYLCDTLPVSISDISWYNLRNSQHLRQPNYRLETMRKSFFPSTTKMWNDLDISVRNSRTTNSFKSHMSKNERNQNNCFLVLGHRKLNILHCRLRNLASSLIYDLFRANLTNTAECRCGNPCDWRFLSLSICLSLIHT